MTTRRVPQDLTGKDLAGQAAPDPATDLERGRRPAASELLAALEAGWDAIRAHHPEVPEAVVVLGTGVERGRLAKLGHWWASQWSVGDDHRGEVLLAGEALHLRPEEVFGVLLHEAAHGLSAARGVRDASRGGRYHNRRFAAAAEEVGLTVERSELYGWTETRPGPVATERYGEAIDRIGAEMRLARSLPDRVRPGIRDPEAPGRGDREGTGRGRRRTQRAAECGCGRKMRMAPTVLARGPVICGLCAGTFSVPGIAAETDIAEREPRAGAPQSLEHAVDDSFLERRAEVLQNEEPASGAPPAALREALDHLERIEEAITRLAAGGDPEDARMAAVFAEAKDGIVEWIEGLFDAEILVLPARDTDPAVTAAEPTRSSVEAPLDLASLELPRPVDPTPDTVPTSEVEGPDPFP